MKAVRLGVCLVVVSTAAAACGEKDAGNEPNAAGTGGAAGDLAGGSGGKADGGASGSGGRAGGGGSAGAVLTGGGAGEAGAAGASGEGGANGNEAGGAGGEVGDRASFLPSYEKGTRLAVNEIRSGDMPPVFVGFHDTELDVDCSFRTATDGHLRCLPDARPELAMGSQLFADAACTERVVTADPSCAPATDTYTSESGTSTACTSTLQPLRATLLATGVTLYADNGGCSQQGQTTAASRYYVLSDAAPADFVEGHVRVLPSSTRLSVQRVEAADGAFQTLALADPEADRECRVFARGSGAICVPAPVFSGRDYRFEDEQCQVPLSLISCTEPLYVADFVGDPGAWVFYEAGDEYQGTVYGGSTASCAEVTGEGPFYRVGAEVMASSFPGVASTRLGTGRLRHDVYRDADGTLLAAGAPIGSAFASEGGLFDTSFDESCDLRRYTDLEQYCIPSSVTTESPFNLYYSDAGCQTQIAACGDGGCPTDLALLQGLGDGAECGVVPSFTSVYTLGQELTLSELYIFYSGRPPGMQCDGPFSTDGYGVLREITGETDAGDFVRVTVTTTK